MAKPTIFISYCHKDEAWKDKLVTHLGVLQQQGYLDIWVDTRIEGGVDWFQEIKEAIDATSIAVLLISADFLNSKFITEKEVPFLLQQQKEKGLRIFPIILKPCDWLGVPWLAQFMARPKDGRPLSVGSEYRIHADLATISKEIRELLQRARLPREPRDQVSLSKLPTTQHALFGRDKELKLLDYAWANPHCHVLSLVAFGGVGKTALVNEWLNRMELDDWRDAERVYGWSFYSQGTREDRQVSADTFFEDALKFFGYTGEPLKSPWDKGKLLASLIKEHKTLLILDGLEPLQYPPGVEEGRLRDQGLQALLKELARFNNGLCLITTRCKVTDIGHTLGKTTHQIDLENLSPEAGMQVLREAGVTNGTDQELQGAAAEYDGHALSLTLLGRYLAIRYDGEIHQRDTINKLAYEKDKQGIHARHVMDSYEVWLKGTPELDLLYIMGLFDRPAPLAAITVLRQKPVIKGLTDNLQQLSDEDWNFTIQHLRDLRLLSASYKGRPDTLDCHPLIREHFGEKLKEKSPNAWRSAHSRLYEYYKNLPEKELPDTLEEMEPLFAAVAHGCQAGHANEALREVYWRRIQRGNEFFGRRKLGAVGAELATLASFFENPWNQLINGLKESEEAFVFNATGFILRVIGRLRESVQPMMAGFNADIKRKDWRNASLAASNLSILYLSLGDINQALNFAHQNLELAERSGDIKIQIDMHAALANILHQQGCLIEAEIEFHSAENIQKVRQPEFRLLYSIQGFYYCDLLLSQDKYKEVIEKAEQTLEWVSRMNWLLDTALDKLSLGRAYLLEAVEQMDSTSEVESIFRKAANYLNQAVTGLRESGNQDELPRGLFARAFLFRIQNSFPHAWDDLDEAQEIAERGGMNLHLVDYHLEAGRVVSDQLALGSFQLLVDGREVTLNRDEMIARLKKHVEQAAELVQQTGYHRRDSEVEMGYVSLFFAQGDKVKAREHLAKAKLLLEQMGIRMWDVFVRELEENL